MLFLLISLFRLTGTTEYTHKENSRNTRYHQSWQNLIVVSSFAPRDRILAHVQPSAHYSRAIVDPSQRYKSACLKALTGAIMAFSPLRPTCNLNVSSQVQRSFLTSYFATFAKAEDQRRATIVKQQGGFRRPPSFGRVVIIMNVGEAVLLNHLERKGTVWLRPTLMAVRLGRESNM